mgnify:CR=1 FL=1
MKTLKKEKGITLIALAVTIIVMLILAGVTIATLTSENGIINQSSKVKETNKVAKTEEEAKLEYSNLILEKKMEGHGEEIELSDVIEKLEENGYETAGKDGKNYIKIGEYYYEIKLENAQVSIAKDRTEGITGVGTGTVASNSQSYVGYYADVNKDGKVDGIIYADLVAGKKGTGTWSSRNDSTYTIPTITSAKSYTISQEKYTEGKFGEKEIITASGSGADRFYVMSLSDLNVAGNTYYWYYSAYEKMSDYATYTKTDFGKGKENTEKMIEKWNNGTSGTTPYGVPNDKDLWKYIQNDVTGKRWFIPSKAEWSAFGGELGITKDNYSTKGLRGWYWTSSQCKNITSWMASFIAGYMTDFLVNQDGISVRLSTIF